jgi:hypothetical protein
MAKLRKILSIAVLGAGVALTVALGVVFPIPPVMILIRRRRIDRTELIQPAPVGERIDLSIPQVPAGMLDRGGYSRFK